MTGGILAAGALRDDPKPASAGALEASHVRRTVPGVPIARFD